MDRREKVVAFDCDDTLIMWKGDGLWTDEEPNVIPVKCIYDGSTVYLKPHTKMIEKLKSLHARGMYIVIWSAAGYEWARSVAEALNLINYSHLILAKPFRFYDDLPITEGLGKTEYIPYEED